MWCLERPLPPVLFSLSFLKLLRVLCFSSSHYVRPRKSLIRQSFRNPVCFFEPKHTRTNGKHTRKHTAKSRKHAETHAYFFPTLLCLFLQFSSPLRSCHTAFQWCIYGPSFTLCSRLFTIIHAIHDILWGGAPQLLRGRTPRAAGTQLRAVLHGENVRITCTSPPKNRTSPRFPRAKSLSGHCTVSFGGEWHYAQTLQS